MNIFFVIVVLTPVQWLSGFVWRCSLGQIKRIKIDQAKMGHQIHLSGH